jgi:hypothetical protein
MSLIYSQRAAILFKKIPRSGRFTANLVTIQIASLQSKKRKQGHPCSPQAPSGTVSRTVVHLLIEEGNISDYFSAVLE